MNAAEVLAQHQYWPRSTVCKCGHVPLTVGEIAAHQLDALKAAGYAVVETQMIESGDVIDKIAKAVGWCENPDPDDPEEAVAEVNNLLWDWVNADAEARS
ncbi:hypothetical protein [Mycolicibacterium bacteremicum]|uniref:Uncharacterized protein n=1 Tax=Mycolicibacterium bacteremicum TaxID=564198 RepID=A0A1W9YPZ6_MYCBA|nr:hypothetical protein [Mycolicibacterium bacteremicum]MCV7434851.1 hypothetical protein [Mycolicibacterium bacteremicum]ORA02148.1 hypothetical protein BST17_24880 [Mycolicibacterium bacteremicum]